MLISWWALATVRAVRLLAESLGALQGRNCARLLDAESRDVNHHTKRLLIFEIGIGERQAVVGGKQRARKAPEMLIRFASNVTAVTNDVSSR